MIAIGVGFADPGFNLGTLVSRAEADRVVGGGEGHSQDFGTMETMYCGGNYSTCETGDSCGDHNYVNLTGSGQECQDGTTYCEAALCGLENSYCYGTTKPPNYICPG
jgi:hypothetical protein